MRAANYYDAGGATVPALSHVGLPLSFFEVLPRSGKIHVTLLAAVDGLCLVLRKSRILGEKEGKEKTEDKES